MKNRIGESSSRRERSFVEKAGVIALTGFATINSLIPPVEAATKKAATTSRKVKASAKKTKTIEVAPVGLRSEAAKAKEQLILKFIADSTPSRDKFQAPVKAGAFLGMLNDTVSKAVNIRPGDQRPAYTDVEGQLYSVFRATDMTVFAGLSNQILVIDDPGSRLYAFMQHEGETKPSQLSGVTFEDKSADPFNHKVRLDGVVASASGVVEFNDWSPHLGVEYGGYLTIVKESPEGGLQIRSIMTIPASVEIANHQGWTGAPVSRDNTEILARQDPSVVGDTIVKKPEALVQAYIEIMQTLTRDGEASRLMELIMARYSQIAAVKK